jgi:hypothetical protein
VVEALRPEARVYAVDPHDGQQGARDRGLQQYPPSLGKLRRTLSMAGLTSRVEVIPARAAELTWDRPLAFLLVDGLHDHAAVAEDFGRFGPHLVEGGLVAFHDHADYYPGVKLFVQELLRGGGFEQVDAAGTMVLLRRCAPGTALTPAPPPEARPVVEVTAERPRVTCIMPTADRRAMVGQAVACFLAQDYPNRELLVVDDGRDPIGDLLPQAPNIRYLRLNARLSIGAKRNLACQQATGQVIAHFDDDDWSAAWRLSYQVAELERERATVCGLNRIYYHQPASGRSWQFIYPSGRRAWLAGNSFCYERQTWLADPFPEIDVGEDARFLWRGRRGRILATSSWWRWCTSGTSIPNTPPGATGTPVPPRCWCVRRARTWSGTGTSHLQTACGSWPVLLDHPLEGLPPQPQPAGGLRDGARHLQGVVDVLPDRLIEGQGTTQLVGPRTGPRGWIVAGGQQDLLRAGRLAQIVGGAQPHGPHRGGHRPIVSHHHQLRARQLGPERWQELQSRSFPQARLQHHQLGAVVPRQPGHLGWLVAGVNDEAPGRQGGRQLAAVAAVDVRDDCAGGRAMRRF